MVHSGSRNEGQKSLIKSLLFEEMVTFVTKIVSLTVFFFDTNEKLLKTISPWRVQKTDSLKLESDQISFTSFHANLAMF